jgi:sulfite exporter TauE/SafE
MSKSIVHIDLNQKQSRMLYLAFITGLLGSFHCVGMCGPIAMMLPSANRHAFTSRILYNLGRAITYACIGGLIGFLGWGVHIIGYQQWLSLLMGGVLLFLGIMNFFNSATAAFYIPGLSKYIGMLKRQLGVLIHYKTYSGNFLLGLLNGFLPCGLVYVALAGALAQGSVIESVLYMFVFGIGTFPLMLVLLIGNQLLSVNIRSYFVKLIPVFTVFVACIIIMRGLNLGIPYLSPSAEPEHKIKASVYRCHE